MGAKEEDLWCDPKACLFSRGVGIFGLIFLSHFLTKMRSFYAHQKGNFLNFSKLTLILSIVHFWYPLWPVKHKGAFFLDTLYVSLREGFKKSGKFPIRGGLTISKHLFLKMVRIIQK